MMQIIEDTRQKKEQHTVKHSHFDEMGVTLTRCALPYGDYMLPPSISVDTKENMSEIAGNLSIDHKRFRQECERAKEAGCHLYILVETEWDIRDISDVHLWQNPRSPQSPKAVTGTWLEKTMKTMHQRYGVSFMFCNPEDAAEYILRILNGEFENGERNT